MADEPATDLSRVWEYTQAVIAVLVVGTTCAGVAYRAVLTEVQMPPEWWTIVGLVVGFYFGRMRLPVRTRRERAGDVSEPR
jgi:hypothetical protein